MNYNEIIDRTAIDRAKRALGAPQTHRREQGTVRVIAQAADAPRGAKAAVLRMQGIAACEHIDRCSGSARGGFSRTMPHAR